MRRHSLILGNIGAGRRIVAVAVTTLAGGLLAPASALATTPNKHEAGEAGRYGLLIAFCALVLPSAAAWFFSRSRAKSQGSGPLALGFRRLLVGEDNRVSTSKTVAAVWTYLLAISLLSVLITKLLGHGEAFGNLQHSGLEGQYGLLIGSPLGAAIAAKGIVGTQVANKTSVKTVDTSGPSPSQLIANDVGNTDLGDLQYVLFNFVAIVFFIGTILESPVDGLPALPDVLFGLTSVSAVGYIWKKVLPSSSPTATLAAMSGGLADVLTITGTSLLANELPTAPVRVLFGVIDATIATKSTTADGKTDTLTLRAPSGLTPEQSVDVTVITPAGIQVKAGTFKLTT